MSNNPCKAITRDGHPCTTSPVGESRLCSHHQQMERMLSLAGKIQPIQKTSAKQTRTTATKIPTQATHVKKNPGPRVASKAPAGTHSKHKPSTIPSYLPAEVPQTSLPCTLDLLTTSKVRGKLILTNYRLHFVSDSSTKCAVYGYQDAVAGVPYAAVKKIAYPSSSSRSGNDHATVVPTHVIIVFKNARRWFLQGDVSRIMTTLNASLFSHSPLHLFAFVAPGKGHVQSQAEIKGHRIFNVQEDFQRMGVRLSSSESCFRLSRVNASYSMCPTYPQALVVPARLSDREIQAVAEFRSKGRIPICSWVHGNSASIWRCAQPKRGIFNAKNHHDTNMIATIRASNVTSDEPVWIVDARPELNARANNFTGGGTESSSIRHAQVSFMNIANIHAMRESFEALEHLALSHSPQDDQALNWLVKVEETKWLNHIRRVLSATLRVAHAVHAKGQTVIVHCSDGWDRTGQICALAQMLLDPHYRTFTGFMQLIEKEWIMVGHKFHDRIGPGAAETDQVSPVFLQFLDCTWQLWRQHPTWFEFNAKTLEVIADHVFSARFGTFMGNCDRERHTMNTVERTRSLWTFLQSHRHEFINPHFRTSVDALHANHSLLPPVASVCRQVSLWMDYYFRYSSRESLAEGNPIPPANAAPEWTPPRSAWMDAEASTAALHARIADLEQEVRMLQTSPRKSERSDPPAAPSHAQLQDM